MNVIAKATRFPHTGDSEGRFPEHSTIILKYVPPFIATVGASTPMPQNRLVSSLSLHFDVLGV